MSETFAEVRSRGAALLEAAGAPGALDDAARLLAWAAGWDAARLGVEAKTPVPAEVAARYEEAIAARAAIAIVVAKWRSDARVACNWQCTLRLCTKGNHPPRGSDADRTLDRVRHTPDPLHMKVGARRRHFTKKWGQSEPARTDAR